MRYSRQQQRKMNKDRLAKMLKLLGEDLSDYATVPMAELTTNETLKLITLVTKEMQERGI